MGGTELRTLYQTRFRRYPHGTRDFANRLSRGTRSAESWPSSRGSRSSKSRPPGPETAALVVHQSLRALAADPPLSLNAQVAPRLHSAMSLEAYVADTRVFFPDKDLGWIAARLTSKDFQGDTVTLEFVDDNAKVSELTPLAPRPTARATRRERPSGSGGALAGLAGHMKPPWVSSQRMDSPTDASRALPARGAVLLGPRRVVGTARPNPRLERPRGPPGCTVVLKTLCDASPSSSSSRTRPARPRRRHRLNPCSHRARALTHCSFLACICRSAPSPLP